ncbi:hypothetical protein WJX73_009447 [Symbiochloris irregularis]|uniref:Alpha-1,3-glucosyltransferase n=1 Tax=Symbiochloris irregularis TaxID=706552 RepID=A0AAW1PG47_9CHLO
MVVAWVGKQACVAGCIFALAVLQRLAVGVGSYSGAGRAPLYGDYEAQRHWMEITLHTPLADWYRDTPSNDLRYWGLDYPPLSAYQSWAYGRAIQAFDPAAVALQTSRGFESAFSKALMRWSSVLSDILVLFPAVAACAHVFYLRRPTAQLLVLAVGLLQPAFVLIDHGHFQYNSISLGLSAGAAAAIAADWYCMGSMLFCLALNHKQMAAYYAPAFFAHLLGALSAATLSIKAGTHACEAGNARCWPHLLGCGAPFLVHEGAAGAALSRLAPLKRGLFEDYVANFWCATSMLIKWKRLLSLPVQVRLCTAATLAAAAPSMLHQVLRPSPRGLLLCMANSAFAFFLFSFQVHEKSILLPLLPITLLAPQLLGTALGLK